MPAPVFKIAPKPGSVRTTDKEPTYERTWVAAGEPNEAMVKAYATAAIPGMVSTLAGILWRQDLRVEEQGHALFHVVAPYARNKQDTGSVRLSFSTTGGTIHITNSKSPVARYPSTATDFKGAINVHGKGGELQVDGTDVVLPATKLSYTFRHPQGVINEAKIRYLSEITGMVNSDAWRGFAAGEALFLGASGSDGSDAEAEVTYEIAYSKNASGLSVGDIAGIAKKGHEFSWISYEDAEDTTSDPGKTLPTKKPKAVYIDRVYDTLPFAAALGF